MQKIRFNGTQSVQKDDTNYGMKFNFTCLTCNNEFHIETFDFDEGDKIVSALEKENSNNAIYCKKCLTNQMKYN